MSKWKPYAEKLANLPIDGSYDVPDYPQDKSSIARFRGGVAAIKCATLVRFAIRAIPRGGIRVIRTGVWDSICGGTEYFQTQTYFPNLLRQSSGLKPWQRRTIIFLGQWWNPTHWREVPPRSAKCDIKGCPYPRRFTSAPLCRHHQRFFDYPISMTDNVLDPSDIFNVREPDAPYILTRIIPYGNPDRMELRYRVINKDREFDESHR